MEILTLDLIEMAHGGTAVARRKGLTIFVPYGIPGEKVRAAITDRRNKYARAQLQQVLRPSPDRVAPRCPHFGVCGGCHFQHMRYEAQLAVKENIVRDQLARIGGFKHASVLPTLPNPVPWAYSAEINLSPTPDGSLGFWSHVRQQVIDIETCEIAHPLLVELLHDIDLELPGLRKLTLRVGDDEALLAALEVEGVEPPQLQTDFPISVAIVLPDNTAASLVGDLHTVQQVRGRDFRLSPGCFFQPHPAGAALIVESILKYAALTNMEAVLELYSGVGMLTAFLAEGAKQITAVEQNPDAVADLAVNLDDFDNVAVYEGWVEEIVPVLDETADLMVLNPPHQGMSPDALTAVLQTAVPRLIYVSADVATLARDGKQLAQGGFKLMEIQPIDALPQTFHIETVSLWQRDNG